MFTVIYSYYSMAYIMYNEIKYRHKGESNIWITIITGIYYIDLSVVISFIGVTIGFGTLFGTTEGIL